MKLPRVRVLLPLLLTAPAPDRVGLAWYEEATVPADLRQRVRDQIAVAAGVAPDAIETRAIERAREVVAYEVPRERSEAQRNRAQRLETARADYRAGRIDAAAQAVDATLVDVLADPGAPGAARLAWEAHVLRAQIAATQGDDGRTEAELRAAITLDPGAKLSTRRVPPAVVEKHRALRESIEADRAAWPTPAITVEDVAAAIEIDGREGLRAVPPGRHVIVVRRVGAAPEARTIVLPDTWTVPPPQVVLRDKVPSDRDAAERVCEALELSRLVVARRRGQRVGLQAYACGVGFGAPWYGEAGTLPRGARAVVATEVAEPRPAATIGGGGPWPQPAVATGQGSDRGPVTPPKKPWFRRAWVWTLIGSVVVAGVVTGAVLGTRDRGSEVALDGPSFTMPSN
jgi:hypothetical protein